MKKLVLFCFLVIMGVLSVPVLSNNGKNDRLLFTQANVLYKQTKFEEALKQYQAIRRKSAAVLYNIGNCFYQLNALPSALWYWKKAEKKWGFLNRQQLYENSALVEKKLGVSKHKQNAPDTDYALIIFNNVIQNTAYIVRCIPFLFVQMLFLFLWFFFFWYIQTGGAPWYRKLSGLLLAFLLLSTGSILVMRYFMHRQTKGIMLHNNPVYAGPAESFTQVGTLGQGECVSIKRSLDDFYKIAYPTTLGYVRTKHVGLI